MTSVEDQLARALLDVGLSCRTAGELLGRSDKSVKAAAERAALGPRMTAQRRAKLDHMTGFLAWLQEGAKAGYLDQAATYFDQLEAYRGRGGVVAKVVER